MALKAPAGTSSMTGRQPQPQPPPLPPPLPPPSALASASASAAAATTDGGIPTVAGDHKPARTSIRATITATVEDSEGTYTGELTPDRRKGGQGTYVWRSTGDSYTGTWEKGAENGKGKLTWKASGSAFKGIFYNGQAVVRGTMRFGVQDTQVTQWWRDGVAVQIVTPSPYSVGGTGGGNTVSDETVTNFRLHLSTWKQLHASLGSPTPPVWTAQLLSSLVSKSADADNIPVLTFAMAASVPQKRGLVLTFPDVDAGAFVTLSDVINRTTTLERSVDYFCRNKTGVNREQLQVALTSTLNCQALEVDAILMAITDLREALLRPDIPQTTRLALSSAAGQALGLFRRPTSPAYPAVALAITETEGALVDKELAAPAWVRATNLFALYKERKALEVSLKQIAATFDATKRMLDASSRTNETAAWCVQSILDVYVMATADAISQRIARASMVKAILMVALAQCDADPCEFPRARTWCTAILEFSLADLEETAHVAKILPPLRNQTEPWDFWEVEQLFEDISAIKETIEATAAAMPLLGEEGSLPPQAPPPIPPRSVEKKPLFRTEPRSLTPVGPPKPYNVFRNGLLPLNKDIVGAITRGQLVYLSELFNSCDNIIQTFAAKLLATIVLPWERQFEAVTGDRRAELVCSETICAHLLGVLVWHIVNGTMNTSLRGDALHLLSRILLNSNMKLLLMAERDNGPPWLKVMIPLLQGSFPTKVLALKIIRDIAVNEKYRKMVYQQIGVWPLHKAMSEVAKGEEEAEEIAGQILGYLCSEVECLREAQKLGALAKVVELARCGRVVLHYQIMEEDLTLEQEIGRGAYASVYRAKWSGKPVAAKVFSESSFEFRLEDFLLEVAILSILHHPNLMHMHGAVVRQSKGAESSFILVSELLSSSLQRILKQQRGGLPPATIHKYACDIAAGLGKTANLLVDSEDRVKVCDFGLSRMVTNLTMTMCAGTPKWEAPECLESSNYSTAADVYSFGIVLWELCTAQEPFAEITNLLELKKAICDKKKRPEIPSMCPTWLREIMKACWHASPKKRPTFEQISERLAAARSMLP